MPKPAPERLPISRRTFLRGSVTAAGLLVTACVAPGPAGEPASAPEPSTATPEPADPVTAANVATATLPPTPQCEDLEDTLAQAAGPFYTPNSPQRQSLQEEGMAGIPLLVTGRVLRSDCTPVTGALLDFWHADDQGRYDNEGFRLRGHQFASEEGVYRLETIVPGLYPGRTRHIHVIVQGENTRRLITQLYWPHEPSNAQDSIFHPALVMELSENEEGQVGRFDFVL